MKGMKVTTKLPLILRFPTSCSQLFFNSGVLIANSHVMIYTISWHLHNFKKVNNTHGGVLLLV